MGTSFPFHFLLPSYSLSCYEVDRVWANIPDKFIYRPIVLMAHVCCMGKHRGDREKVKVFNYFPVDTIYL